MTGRQLNLRKFLLILAAISAGTVVLLLGAGFVYALIAPESNEVSPIRLPDPSISAKLPRDWAAHADFTTEWWTIYANLTDDSGRVYGVNLHVCKRIPLNPTLAVFRRRHSLPAPEFIAYLAVADISGKKQVFGARHGRRSNDYHAGQEKLDLTLADWRIKQTATGLALRAQTTEAAVNLNLIGTKPPVRHGQNGYAWRGEDLPPAYVLSWPRMAVDGSLMIDGAARLVTGLAWMEREYTSYLPAPRLTSWDRLVLMLDNHYELVLWDLRCGGEQRCAPIPTTLISPDGIATELPSNQVFVNPSEAWISPQTGAKYNVEWQIKLDAHDVALLVSAQLPSGELSYRDGDVHVWTSPLHVAGRWGAQAVQGSGYGEISGLVDPLARRY